MDCDKTSFKFFKESMIGLELFITVNHAHTFILTGVNTPDHGVMFSTLVTTLQDKVSPLVAILKSKDCNSVKNTLSKTLTQLFQNPLLVSLCQLIPPPPRTPKKSFSNILKLQCIYV